MNIRTIIASIAIGLAMTPAASAQSRETLSFESVIRLGVGEVTKAEGAVERGDVVLSFPYEYRRTGVLQNDVRGTGRFALRSLYAAAGTPGFMLGEFSMAGGSRGTAVWCFQRPPNEDPDRPERIVCFLGGWPIQFVRPPLLISSFAINPNSQPSSEVPVVEETPVTLPFELRLEYRMRSWNRRFLELDLYHSGERINTFSVPRAADGSATLPSVAGSMRFVQQDRVTIATPVAEDDSPSLSELRDLMQALGASGASTIESPLIATEALEPSGAYSTVSRNDIVMSQQVGTPPPRRLDAAPDGNAERYGDAGTLVYPGLRGNFFVSCRSPAPPPPGERSRARAYCLEDSDNDGAFDAMWTASFADRSGVFLVALSPPARRLDAPVTASEAPDGEQPRMRLNLRYRGPAGDRRTDDGVLAATGVQFSWVANDNAGDMGTNFDFVTPIGADGEGVIRTPSGVVLGRVRNVNVATSMAEILIESGLPVGERFYLSGRRGAERAVRPR